MNSLRKQVVYTLKTTQKLQQLKKFNYSSALKQQQQQIQKISSIQQFYQKPTFNFCAKNEQEQKQEQEKEEESTEELPNSLNKLLQLNTPEAIAKIKQMYKNLEDEVHQQKKHTEKMQDKYEVTEKANSDLQGKISDLRKSLQVELDDMELARKRLQKEKENEKQFAITKFAKEMLDTTDNLERALDASKENKSFESLLEGTELTYNNLMKSLQRNGVVQVNPFKEQFDPNLHDALMKVNDPKLEPNTIAFVIQSGYMINDRVLRAAKVGVVMEQENKE